MTFYRIARIVNTYGIKGQLKVLLDTDFIEERFAKGNRLFIIEGDRQVAQVTVANFRPQKGAYVVGFEEYQSINQVEVFKGLELAIDQADQAPLEEDSYYHHQIIGLQVFDQEGQVVGVIKDIMPLPANDVWVVKPAHAGKEILLPFIEDVVKEVDLDGQRVVIERMEGLIDED